MALWLVNLLPLPPSFLYGAVFAAIDPGGLLFAQGNKSYAASWAIVLGCVILGLLVTLRPSHRRLEIKRSKED